MSWGFVALTQIILAVAVVGLIGWSIYAIVRAIVTQMSKK